MEFGQKLIVAARTLVKTADLPSALKSLAYPDEPDDIYSPVIVDSAHYTEGPEWWNMAPEKHFVWRSSQSAIHAYEQCPVIPAILNRKAQCYINGKTWIMNTAGKEAQNPQAKLLRKLFSKPNALQSWKQFEAQGNIYKGLMGFNVVLAIKPAGFKDPIDTTSLWNIPPSMLNFTETNKLFYQTDLRGIVKEIVLTYKGERTALKLEDLFIMKDNQPSFDSMILPGSKLQALEMPINNIIGAYESRNMLINYRGALGILTQDPGSGQYGALPMEKDQKTQLQKDFAGYGLRNKQMKIIITSAAVRWQQMGTNTRDLMLMEEVENSSIDICDLLNFPPHLLGLKDPTFNNRKEAQKDLYQNSIIPDAESDYEQWNQFFKTDEYGLNIVKDFSAIPVLQEDQASAMTARRTRNEALQIEWENDMLTRNRWRELNGEDTIPGDDLLRSQLVTENSNEPLVASIGVGGVQGIIAVVQAQMPTEAKRATLEIVFGLSAADAARMAPDVEPVTENTNNTQNDTDEEDDAGS
jgi:hypothetical protein